MCLGVAYIPKAQAISTTTSAIKTIMLDYKNTNAVNYRYDQQNGWQYNGGFLWGNVDKMSFIYDNNYKEISNFLVGKSEENGLKYLLSKVKDDGNLRYSEFRFDDMPPVTQDQIRSTGNYSIVGNKIKIGTSEPTPTPTTSSPSPLTPTNTSSGTVTQAASPATSISPSTAASSSSSGIFGDSLPEYISNIYNWSIGVAAGLAVIMLIYAGYLYVTSAGNPESINLAKEIIIGAIAGFVFLILAALILRFVM